MKRVRKNVIASWVCFSLCASIALQNTCYAMKREDLTDHSLPHAVNPKPENPASSSPSKTSSFFKKFTLVLALTSSVMGETRHLLPLNSNSLYVPEPLHSLNPSPAPLTLSSPPDFSQMSRKDLEEFALGLHQKQLFLATENSILKQITSGMSPQEQALSLVLSTPLTSTHMSMIYTLNLVKSGHLSFEEALKRVGDDIPENIDIPPVTLGEVLTDENISNDTARKVFRGLINGLNEESTLDLKRGRFSDLEKDKRVEECITYFLRQPYHLTQVLYPIGSLTDSIIRKFSEKREWSFTHQINGHLHTSF